MKTTTNINDVIVKIRNMLISQSQLPSDRVLNSLSLRGTELDELLSENEEIYNGISISNTTLLFELRSIQSNSNVSMEEGDIYNSSDLMCSDSTICNTNTICGDILIDRSITYYKMYELYIIIYGENGLDTAIKLASRMRSQEVRSNLYMDGIYIEKVSDPNMINEFKNDTMWLRNDISINLGLKFAIDPTSLPSEYKNINSINIIRR